MSASVLEIYTIWIYFIPRDNCLFDFFLNTPIKFKLVKVERVGPQCQTLFASATVLSVVVVMDLCAVQVSKNMVPSSVMGFAAVLDDDAIKWR
jgi:hypothetical protein